MDFLFSSLVTQRHIPEPQEVYRRSLQCHHANTTPRQHANTTPRQSATTSPRQSATTRNPASGVMVIRTIWEYDCYTVIYALRVYDI